MSAFSPEPMTGFGASGASPVVGFLGVISVKSVWEGACVFAATLVVASAANAGTFVENVQFNATGSGVYHGTFLLSGLPYGQKAVDATYFIFTTATPPSSTVTTDVLTEELVYTNPYGGPDIVDDFYNRNIVTTTGFQQPNYFIFKDYVGDSGFGSIPEVQPTDTGLVYQGHFDETSDYTYKHYSVYTESIATGYAGDSNLIVQANDDMIWGINHGVAPSFQVSVVGDYTTLEAVGLLVHTGDAGVPEPGSWALMLLGLGLAGAALRRRRRTRLDQPRQMIGC